MPTRPNRGCRPIKKPNKNQISSTSTSTSTPAPIENYYIHGQNGKKYYFSKYKFGISFGQTIEVTIPKNVFELNNNIENLLEQYNMYLAGYSLNNAKHHEEIQKQYDKMFGIIRLSFQSL